MKNLSTKKVSSKDPKKTLLATIHEAAQGLHKAGVMDIQTMRELDDLCLSTETNQAEVQA